MTVLGEILELSYGKALKESDRDGGRYPVVGSGGVVGCHSHRLTEAPTIVVGRKGSIGTVTWIDGPAWPIDTAYFVKSKRDDLDRRWTYWMLKSLHMEQMNKSAAVPGLNRDDVYRLDIDLPTLSEQRRIASILDHADALRTKRRQALAHLDSLTQSIFHEKFEGIDAPTRLVSLGEVANLAGGRNLVGSDDSVESPYRVLKISAVTSGHFRQGESKPLPVDYIPATSHLVRQGDLLMSRANTTELVGATAFVNNEPPPNLALPDKIWKFEWKHEDSHPVYFHAVMSSPRVRRRVSQLSSGTGGSMKNISKAKLGSLLIPVAKPQDQHEFAVTINAISELSSKVHAQIACADDLFDSLQSRAFRGEL